MFFKYELFRIIKTRKCVFFIILMLLLPFMDLLMNYYSTFEDFWKYPEAYEGVLPLNMILHPSFASFLSCGSEGHIPQMLYVWVLPIYLLIIYSDFYIQEKKIGYISILLNKGKRSRFLISRYSISFLLPFIVSFVSLTINFLLACLLFRGGTEFHSMDTYYMEMHNLFVISFEHPFLAYFLYIIVFSIIAGGCGIFCTSICFLFPNYKLAYSICFFIWYIQISNRFSITYVIQPFIEYGLSYIIPAVIIFFFTVAVTMILSMRYKVAHDEL